MTPTRFLEIGAAALGAGGFVATAIAQADVIGWAKVLLPIGAAVVTALVANRITSERNAVRMEERLDSVVKELGRMPGAIASSEGRMHSSIVESEARMARAIGEVKDDLSTEIGQVKEDLKDEMQTYYQRRGPG